LVGEKNGWSDEQVAQWAQTRKRTRKFQEDVWS